MNRGCGCAVLKVQSVTHFLFSAPDAVYFQSGAWVCSAPSRPFSCSALCCTEADSESLHLQALVPTGCQLSSADGWQALVGRLEVGVRGEKSGYLSPSLLPSAASLPGPLCLSACMGHPCPDAFPFWCPGSMGPQSHGLLPLSLQPKTAVAPCCC